MCLGGKKSEESENKGDPKKDFKMTDKDKKDVSVIMICANFTFSLTNSDSQKI
jgi:hypothetical protein